MEIGCIYARKNTFAKRYDIVKLFCLTGTPTPYAIRGGAGGLVPHRPREEKNGYNSTTGSSENHRKSRNKPITWCKYRSQISVIIDLVKSKNPYIFFTFYKTQKCQSVMLSVGGTKSPHTHNTLQAFTTFYAGEGFLQGMGEEGWRNQRLWI